MKLKFIFNILDQDTIKNIDSLYGPDLKQMWLKNDNLN